MAFRAGFLSPWLDDLHLLCAFLFSHILLSLILSGPTEPGNDLVFVDDMSCLGTAGNLRAGLDGGV